ncbi:uncharacterized protein LOC115876309 [Sitophilus oryzae]|uniref:Uncharacterized protein LOC115876309 n=1 Tax=Sitophilus oryzae TaxID=7048 RepID=A0A6J2XAB6_SITOR|nr:uncharacterized protein LOC115876309 [Sitophilus oryzae]
MYRQILVEPSQRSLQKILWRSSPSEDVKVYKLNTVTYGQACASFLSIRCLFQLADEYEKINPDIANIIRQDFYVDHLLTGADSIPDAQYICNEISKVLKDGCFELRKWYSNEPSVVSHMDNATSSCEVLEFTAGEKAKTLGLTWSCQDDFLMYHIEEIPFKSNYTKRSVLSVLSKLFDPLGLLSPCIVLAKIFMQRLWLQKVSWDEPLTLSLSNEWSKFCKDLPNLNSLQISRHVLADFPSSLEIHGFSDASERVYGACLYIKSIDSKGFSVIRLLCAKSKVAPVKSLTIPKLELCAALLLSKLVNKVLNSIQLFFERIVLWSDSTIALAWIRTPPNTLKVFVSNRVAEIQALTEDCEWRYIPSTDNPADLVSRGLLPSQMLTAIEWWQGPSWLAKESIYWPQNEQNIKLLPELKSKYPLTL